LIDQENRRYFFKAGLRETGTPGFEAGVLQAGELLPNYLI